MEITNKALKNKKILHIIPYPLLPLIGPCFRCLRQLRALKNHGIDAVLLMPEIKDKKDLAKLKESAFHGIDIYPLLPHSSAPALRELGFLFFSWLKINTALGKIRPDIVHVHNPPDTLAFVTSVICSLRKIPLVYDIHDSSKEVIGATEFNPLLKKLYLKAALFFEKQTIKRACGIVTVSESLKKLLLDTRVVFQKYSPHFIVMRNIDESCRALIERKTVDEGDYIYYSGTLYSRFIGLEFLIDSIRNMLIDNKIRLFIAGDGPYKSVFEKYISDNGLSDSVELLGYLGRDENIAMIERAAVTAIPYERNALTEIALPNKLFEYMALGKPIVYPDLPGFREVMGGENAGKYRPDDKDDLQRVIENMLADEELRKSVGAKNRSILNEITFEKEFSKLLDLYRLILQN